MHTLDLFFFWRWQYHPVKVPAAVFGIDCASGLRNEADEIENRARIWREIVENYSGRKLTISEDRLPALAGIASELNVIWGDQYLAGMWRSILLRQITWGSDWLSPDEPPIIQSPSWSWISYEEPARFYEVVDVQAEVLQCEVLLKNSESRFSAVKEGKLVLRAQCLNQDSRLSKDLTIREYLAAIDKYQEYTTRWDYNRNGPDGKPFLSPYALFTLIGYGSYDNHSSYEALIIEPLGNGTFRRVGLFLGYQDAKWPVEAEERVVIIM